MKLSLVVATKGKSQGKVIPIAVPQFWIGRDEKCHLRPATPLVSKRHCAIIVRGDKVVVRDFDSTNGTFINEVRLQGEKEIVNGDVLKVGPLEFTVALEKGVPVDRPTPIPPTRSEPATNPEDDAAALLLSLQDEGSPDSPPVIDSQGSTVLETMTTSAQADTAETNAAKPAKTKEEAAKAAAADTSKAAKAILDKYIRRPRF